MFTVAKITRWEERTDVVKGSPGGFAWTCPVVSLLPSLSIA